MIVRMASLLEALTQGSDLGSKFVFFMYQLFVSVGKTLNPSEIVSLLDNMVLTIPALQASMRRCALLNASYGVCSLPDSFIHLHFHFFIRCCERPLYVAQCQALGTKG